VNALLLLVLATGQLRDNVERWVVQNDPVGQFREVVFQRTGGLAELTGYSGNVDDLLGQLGYSVVQSKLNALDELQMVLGYPEDLESEFSEARVRLIWGE
jgi:hypothetical protein